MIRIGVYQGESRKVDGNIKLGELDIAVPPEPKGSQSVDVRFTYDINGLLEVEVTAVKTQDTKRIVIEKNPGSLSKREIDERLKLLSKLKIHPRDKEENRLLLARGERLYEEHLGDMREAISYQIDIFERALSSQDEKLIRIKAKEFKEFLDHLEGRYRF